MNKLEDTVNVVEKPVITEEQIDEVFGESKNQTSSNDENQESSNKRIITIAKSERQEKMCRPTFEIPESYHKKLQLICTAESTTIGKLVADIVKEWLDGVEVSL